jgi:hypothetical protein
VSQISPPVRILLVGAVVFLAAWFTILKPKPVTAESTPAQSTAETAYGKAVTKAKNVATKVAATADATATPAAADSGAATPPAGGAAPAAQPPVEIPAEELAKLPKTVAAALEQRKILVLGVFADGATNWRPMADDDRYVRNALRRTNRYDGDVAVKDVDISELSRYGALVNELDVIQSPSVVVIDRELKGRVLTGYVDRITINQTIADARDATTSPHITDSYLRELNAACGDSELRFARWSLPTVRGEKAAKASLNRLLTVARRSRNQIARTDAPAEWRSLKTQMLHVLDADYKTGKSAIDKIKHGDLAGARSVLSNYDYSDARALDRRFNKVGLTNCAANRRA